MKGVVSVSLSPPKRRWRHPAVPAVLVLVVLSLLVPLAFLLGFHNNRSSSGYSTDDRSHKQSQIRNYGHLSGVLELAKDPESRIDNLIKRFKPALSKNNADTYKGDSSSHKKHDNEVIRERGQSTLKEQDKTVHSSPINLASQTKLKNHDVSHKQAENNAQPKDVPTVQLSPSKQLPASSIKNLGKTVTSYESGKSCQVRFGSYCLWLAEHRQVMKDSTVKTLKDQLFVARAYYPSVSKLRGQEKLSRELKQNIQEHERMLSDVIVDADLPLIVGKNIKKMDQKIAKAKSCTVDCSNVEKKLRQILDLTEDEANFHMKQSAFLYSLGVQTIPKCLHCLSMRLTVEHFRSLLNDQEHLLANKINNSKYMHYVIFSNNILAASVVINSTVTNSEVTAEIVFHLVTSAQNYYAMKVWFARSSFKEATIHIINFEELNLKRFSKDNFVQLSSSEEFRVSLWENDLQALQLRTKYISVFGHSHFFLPEIFKDLKKVVVLDDDLVVQRDLSTLWDLNLQGKVNGAVEFCGMRLGQLKTILGTSNYNADSCTWMSGLNVIDLEKWRKHNITTVYLQLIQKLQTSSELSWRAATLPASLLAFKDHIYPLDSSWSVSDLGHDYGASENRIKSAATLHYNGNMKPWLDLGIPKYKNYWRKFLTREEPFMNECNVNP